MFSSVSESVIGKIINDISAKNSSGPDGIDTKLLKLAKHENHSTEYAALELIDHISNNLGNGKVPFSNIFRPFQSLCYFRPHYSRPKPKTLWY